MSSTEDELSDKDVDDNLARHGEDAHVTKARQLLRDEGVDYDKLPADLKSQRRDKAKSVNFALNNGASPLGPAAAEAMDATQRFASEAVQSAKKDAERAENMYSAEEREKMIEDMKVVSSTFYRMAAAVGCHAFIEFCGLMNEFINMCEAAHKEGHDFNLANIHCGHSLPLKTHMAGYLGEKLGCIYGTSLKDPELFLAMCEKMELLFKVSVDDDS